jgi:hypothetical protein
MKPEFINIVEYENYYSENDLFPHILKCNRCKIEVKEK